MRSYNVRGNYIETTESFEGQSSSVTLKKNQYRSIARMFGDFGFVDSTFEIPEDLIVNQECLVFAHRTNSDDSFFDGSKLEFENHYTINSGNIVFESDTLEKLVHHETVIEVVFLDSSISQFLRTAYTFYKHSDEVEVDTGLLSSNYVSVSDFYNNVILFTYGRFLKPLVSYRVSLSGSTAKVKFIVKPDGSLKSRTLVFKDLDVYELTPNLHVTPNRISNSTSTQERSKEQLTCLPDTTFRAY